MKRIKETYLLFIIIMGLISLSLYSTYALFTASSTLEDVVSFSNNLTTNSNIIEYERIVVPVGETKSIELKVTNNYDSTLYYGVWYEMVSSNNPKDVVIGLYNDDNQSISTNASGQITSGTTINLLVGITNGSTEELVVNIGTIGSSTSNLSLSENRVLLDKEWIELKNFKITGFNVDGLVQTTLPKDSYTVTPSCIDATATFDYENWAFELSNLSTTNSVLCTPSVTTKTKQYLNTYIKDSLTGTNQGLSKVVNENGYRYEGEDPYNYIRFNNELWRIIGVFETEIINDNGVTETKYLTKIIRDNPIGSYAWDGINKNNWQNSSLYSMLNNYYFNSEDGTGSDSCYKVGEFTGVLTTIQTKCNFVNNGIKSSYQPMVENVKWYLGGYSSNSATTENFYTYERSNEDTYYYTNNRSSKTANGYIGLMNVSDFGYSVLASYCSRTTKLESYNSSRCAGKSWLYKYGSVWTINAASSTETNSFYLSYRGDISLFNDHGVVAGFNIRPVLYLSSSVYILSGDGSETNPYIIAM